MEMTGHALASVETSLTDRRCRTRCRCGWKSGWRRDRPTALRAVGAHVDDLLQMTAERAEGIVADHVRGLHADYDDLTVGCTYIGCEEGHEIMALADRRADRAAVIGWQAEARGAGHRVTAEEGTA